MGHNLASYLLASDMDGTLIPLESGAEWEREIAGFNALVQAHPELLLAYVTGRHLQLAREGTRRHGLPEPDVYVCDVGTSVYRRLGDRWVRDEDYRRLLQNSWAGRTGGDIGVLLSDISGLTPQEKEKQGEFKQSYYLAADQAESMVALVRERLAGQGVAANLIYSVDPLTGEGLLDILPERAAKDHAVAYLRQSLPVSHHNLVYAGDSGNDLAAFVCGCNAIVVRNTAEPVKEQVRRIADQRRIGGRIYFARSPYVKGVVEGCFHFKLFQRNV